MKEVEGGEEEGGRGGKMRLRRRGRKKGEGMIGEGCEEREMR